MKVPLRGEHEQDTEEVAHMVDKELILVLLKLFQETEEEEAFPKSFQEAIIITLIPKPMTI